MAIKKYWGQLDDYFVVPLNDSFSVTIEMGIHKQAKILDSNLGEDEMQLNEE